MAETLQRTFVLRGEADAGALWAFLKANWRALAADGKPLAVLVTLHKTKRSTEQNKRLWALLGEISRNAWVQGRQFSAEAWNEHFAGEFIGYEELPSGRRKGISTTTLSVAEMAEYQTRIEAYAASELGIQFSQ